MSTDKFVAEEIVRQVLDGDLDEYMDGLSGAIRMRRTQLVNDKAAEFRRLIASGETIPVYFNTTVTPKYLRGIRATILDYRGDEFTIRIERNTKARRFSGATTTAKASILDRVK